MQGCRALLSDYSVGWWTLEMNYSVHKEVARAIQGATHVKANLTPACLCLDCSSAFMDEFLLLPHFKLPLVLI